MRSQICKKREKL